MATTFEKLSASGDLRKLFTSPDPSLRKIAELLIDIDQRLQKIEATPLPGGPRHPAASPVGSMDSNPVLPWGGVRGAPQHGGITQPATEGPTAMRPRSAPNGFRYHDTTLDADVFFDGLVWRRIDDGAQVSN